MCHKMVPTMVDRLPGTRSTVFEQRSWCKAEMASLQKDKCTLLQGDLFNVEKSSLYWGGGGKLQKRQKNLRMVFSPIFRRSEIHQHPWRFLVKEVIDSTRDSLGSKEENSQKDSGTVPSFEYPPQIVQDNEFCFYRVKLCFICCVLLLVLGLGGIAVVYKQVECLIHGSHFHTFTTPSLEEEMSIGCGNSMYFRSRIQSWWLKDGSWERSLLSLLSWYCVSLVCNSCVMVKLSPTGSQS